MNKWYEEIGKNQDTVISTRIRFARNLSGVPFPHHATPEQKQQVINTVASALEGVHLKDKVVAHRVDMDKVTSEEAGSYVERHIISPDFAENREGKALFITDDEKISIMVNEEDHIRIQVLASGEDLKNALELASKIDDLLDSRLSYAYSERFGYLTGCPTNLGTGLRASVMMFLPAIERMGHIGKLSNTLSKLGLVIRGTFGEGSEVKGSLYQVSNQVSLGIDEETAVENLVQITGQIIEQELQLRDGIITNSKNSIEDKIFRALGISKYAKMMSYKEMIEISELIRLGIYYGMLENMSVAALNKLLFETGPYGITCKLGENVNSEQRDKCRGDIVRECFK